MKRKTNPILTEDDGKIIQLFIELGMPKNLAKTLMYISHVNECRSREIEHGAELLQPQVSIAIQELTRRGWVKKHRIKKKKGKGRPVHFYRLTSTLPKILTNFEQQKMLEIETIKKQLADLEHIIQPK